MCLISERYVTMLEEILKTLLFFFITMLILHNENIVYLGSEDATTCIITVLRHPSSGVTALGHLNCYVQETFRTILNKVLDVSKCNSDDLIELQIVGGVIEEKHYAQEIFYHILKTAHEAKSQIHLTLACVGELNTSERNGILWPIVYGAGINLRSGEIFPATFTDKGPDETIRFANVLSGSQKMIDLYNTNTGLLEIGPFDYVYANSISFYLKSTDEFILQNLSTTPLVEPPDFVKNIKESLKFLRDNPSPLETIFKHKPRLYEMDEKSKTWKMICGV